MYLNKEKCRQKGIPPAIQYQFVILDGSIGEKYSKITKINRGLNEQPHILVWFFGWAKRIVYLA